MTRNMSQRQFNMTQGPQGYQGPEGASEERRLGSAYLADMAKLNAGEDASYFPGQNVPGTMSQGKFFHDPKPHDAVRFQRGYTPERQQVVHDMISPQVLTPKHRYEDMNEQTKNKHPDQAKWEATEDSRFEQRRAKNAVDQQVRSEFVGTVARSDVPNEDMARLKRSPTEENYGRGMGITIRSMKAEDQGRAAGQIQHGREIEMPLRSKSRNGAKWDAQTTIHELGHALDHVDRKTSGRPDYNDNQRNLTFGTTSHSEEKVEAVRDLGRMEGAADVYAYKYARDEEGNSLAGEKDRDYPAGHYSKAYGSDTGWSGGRNARRTNKFTSEETKGFRAGYQEVHKAEGVKSPSKRGKIQDKEREASRARLDAAWGAAGKPKSTLGHPSPQLQVQDDAYAAGVFSEERTTIRKANAERNIPWSKFKAPRGAR